MWIVFVIDISLSSYVVSLNVFIIQFTSNISMMKVQNTTATLHCSDLISWLFLTHLLPRARVTPALASLSWLSILSFMPLRSVCERDEKILYLRITEGKKTLWRHTRTRCSSKRTPLCDLELSLLLSQSDPCIFPCGLYTPPFMAEWNLPEQVWLQIHCTVRTIITHSSAL